MKPKIVNIINFIRANEPYCLETLKNQIKKLKRHNLPATFLIEYDAMIKPEFVDLLTKELDKNDEIGLWLETVQPLVEKAGLLWRGRSGFSWDWHSDVGMTVGYEPKERESLVDIAMEDFKSIFGEFPVSVGTWVIDAHTLGYMADKYSIVAACNCKDQWGTDGYTLWGGYYNQAYYPSRKNAFTPAQTLKNQIPVPVFRMLGSDPIYQYDEGLDRENGYNPSSWQNVITLEPVYPYGGGLPEWVQWYFKENFNDLSLSFGYTQVGQENSFGWEAMKKGFEYQVEFVAENVKNGLLEVQTLRESGTWFKSKYDLTPVSAICALSDWRDMGHKSVWYNSRYYRVNFLWEGNKCWIRDIHIFDEKYNERYLKDKCTENGCIYDNLPVVDGNLWSGGNIRAGIYPVEVTPDGTNIPLIGAELDIRTLGEEEMLIQWSLEKGGDLKIHCKPKSIEIGFKSNQACISWGMQLMYNNKILIPITDLKKSIVSFKYNDYEYEIHTSTGHFDKLGEKNAVFLVPDKDEIVLEFSNA